MAPAALLGACPGERVLDLCAAPGGKSTQIAGAMNGRGLLVSNEIHPKRARILSGNLERMGVANALVVNETPARLAERLPGWFDRVLVDAPCSGEGMFRKEEAALTDWSEDTVAMCAARQKMIRYEAAKMLRPGGRLVYSTCTFAPEENEGAVEAFLKNHPDFRPEAVEAPRFSPGLTGTPGMYRLWPHRLKGEGHFAAVLRKTDAGAAVGRPQTAESSEYRNPSGWRPMAAPAELPPPVERLLSELGIALPAGKAVIFGDRIFWAPPEMPELRGLKVLRPGLELAELRRDLAVPAHALALWAKGAASVQDLSADEPACAAWLRGETVPTSAAGWTLVRVDGLSLERLCYNKTVRIKFLHSFSAKEVRIHGKVRDPRRETAERQGHHLRREERGRGHPACNPAGEGDLPDRERP